MQTELSESGKAILEYLVGEIRRGRFRPDDEKTFCGYKEIHEQLSLNRKGPNWGNSLRTQGLGDLAHWIKTNALPALTGLIVDQEDFRPGPGYYDVNGVDDGDEKWWRRQVRDAIATDWSAWVQDYDPVSERELAELSLSIIEGKQREVTASVRVRCEKLRKRAREYFRDADGFLRCRVCGWYKSDARISGDIVELHHIDPIADTPEMGIALALADALKLLVPLCPTCHRIIHARIGGGMFRLEELAKIIQKGNAGTD